MRSLFRGRRPRRRAHRHRFFRRHRVGVGTGSGKLLRELEGRGGPLLSAAFSADGARVITASWDRTARVRELELNPQPVNLGGLIDEVVGAAQELAEKNRNRLLVERGAGRQRGHDQGSSSQHLVNVQCSAFGDGVAPFIWPMPPLI